MTMAVLSVDLATRRWSDLGIVMLKREQAPRSAKSSRFSPDSNAPKMVSRPIACEIIPWNDPGTVDANTLAGRLNHLCNLQDIRILMLSGPQAWKSSSNGLKYARVSEQQLNTVAKTGLPGMVSPLTHRPFAEFCLDLYDALCRRGWQRLATREQPGLQSQERLLVESAPHAAWKSMGLKPLPTKRKARVSDLAEAYAALREQVNFTTNRPPNHDQLQAIVAGLAGLALEEHSTSGARIVGTPPRREEGHWREGFIVLPTPPRSALGLRWLH